MSKMMRIDTATHEKLADLSKSMKKTKQAVMQEAVEALARELFVQKANEEYAKLLKDPSFVQQEREEREDWDVTLADGSHDDEQ
jgi:predicted transcriptional regulator